MTPITTRADRILVKVSNLPSAARLNLDGLRLNASFTPLFESIGRNDNLIATKGAARWYTVSYIGATDVNAWDLCHRLQGNGMGIAGAAQPEFAEPDFQQAWLSATPSQHAFAAVQSCNDVVQQKRKFPTEPDNFWFRDDRHSQLEAARSIIGSPSMEDMVRIAHLDTGYDPNHSTKPKNLLENLAKNYVDGDHPDDAHDYTSGLFANLGHGSGTLSILAGNIFQGKLLGGAAELGVIPIRVANSVILFYNSAIAQALDYVHSLYADPRRRAHVVTMSMGGLASHAWSDAVNALYELGVFIVTAAGNNFGNLPTRHIVFPARFKRVVAACGVMADGTPYADLGLTTMAGNYGPVGKMKTAISACTPNVPWARLGCRDTVDFDGAGTSAATPQIAAAAALWIQKNKGAWEKYPKGWMRVEAVRKALFDSALLGSPERKERLGTGMVQASAALERAAAPAAELNMQDADSASFSFLRTISGLGTAPSKNKEKMLELEALQLSQRWAPLGDALKDPENPPAPGTPGGCDVLEALRSCPYASKTLKTFLDSVAPVKVALGEMPVPKREQVDLSKYISNFPSLPLTRKLRVFAFDPMLGYRPDFVRLNETTLEVKWESLEPGPVGDYLEVVDIDPATECAYAPVDLNHPALLSQDGLAPMESNPQFHQQMAYAVAMTTIQCFEGALGRVALWAPRFSKETTQSGQKVKAAFVRRLRIYPHALREANSFYNRAKKALLLGYFKASENDHGQMLPGGMVYCSLSHDIIAHETTHALLDGLHRYFGEPTNEDVLAFHEAFADIVALFQHFTIPEALFDQISRTRGDLASKNLLAELARQFGEAIGQYGALRDYIGTTDKKSKKWQRLIPTGDEYQAGTEVHDRGAVLVAAVFDAFLDIYNRRSDRFIRAATQGSGILPNGALPHDLTMLLAEEASRCARHVLNICIRALDYCPPVDLRFGEYLRALITADTDLSPTDKWAYRNAFVQSFFRRGIYPTDATNLSPKDLCWERPNLDLDWAPILGKLDLSWDLRLDRRRAFELSEKNGREIHVSLSEIATTAQFDELGLYKLGTPDASEERRTLGGEAGTLRNFEVHSVRPIRRVGPGPDYRQQMALVIEITQTWIPDSGGGQKFRGGSTLLFDLPTQKLRYLIRKHVAHANRVAQQKTYLARLSAYDPAVNYFGLEGLEREPFAMTHRHLLKKSNSQNHEH